MVAHMYVSGSYIVIGALTQENPAAAVMQHIFKFSFSSSSPYAISTSEIKAITCRSILASYSTGTLYYLVDVPSGTESFVHLVTVNSDFTSISSSLVTTTTSLQSPMWEGHATFGT